MDIQFTKHMLTNLVYHNQEYIKSILEQYFTSNHSLLKEALRDMNTKSS